MKKVKKILTTGQAAKILGISQQTVIRLCDNKELKSFKVPGGSRHRRIPVEALFVYARENNIPVDYSDNSGVEPAINKSAVSGLTAKTTREEPIEVLVIDEEGGTTYAIEIILSKRNCEVRRVNGLFPAGAMAGRFSQDIILVGLAFAKDLRSILRTFPREQLKIIQETEDGYPQDVAISSYLDEAYERRQQKENRSHIHPQVILCI